MITWSRKSIYVRFYPLSEVKFSISWLPTVFLSFFDDVNFTKTRLYPTLLKAIGSLLLVTAVIQAKLILRHILFLRIVYSFCRSKVSFLSSLYEVIYCDKFMVFACWTYYWKEVTMLWGENHEAVNSPGQANALPPGRTMRKKCPTNDALVGEGGGTLLNSLMH